jgi:hypothetical protein
VIGAGSRYTGIGTATWETPDGRTIVYLRRRFIAPPERFALVHRHTVQDGDRPDLLAFHYLGDTEQFWRIADPNVVFSPNELTDERGRRLAITLPEGIPGIPTDA